MAIHALQNQYFGINAHLQSQLQVAGGWKGFHTNHLVDLQRRLIAQLEPLDYTAEIEDALQVRYGHDASRPESDITVYDEAPDRSGRYVPPDAPGVDTDHVVVSIPTLLGLIEDEISTFKAIAIYASDDQRDPVAWIELLSPSNKPGGSGYLRYCEKREMVLQTGLVFVELDYLHHTSPTFESVADYRQEVTGAHAFHIVVIDPRPVFLQGKGHIYQFDVDEPIPRVDLPLNAGDVVTVDFDAAYQQTLHSVRYGRQVDYAQLPVAFERYSQADQQRILSRMLTVRDHHTELDKGPFPRQYDDLSLAEAQARLAQRE